MLIISRLVLEVCWPDNLEKLESPRTARDAVSKDKVHNSKGLMAAEIVLWPSQVLIQHAPVQTYTHALVST